LNTDWVDELCNAANARKFSTLILPVALDGSFRVACQAAAQR
jgi:hypothetical protein